jgi:drug/metabolite transporter (DMT)-like permease
VPAREEGASLEERLAANCGLFLMVVGWGAFFPILDRILLNWDIFSATLARQVVGAAALFGSMLLLGRRDPLPVRIPWIRVLMLGGVGVALGSLLTSAGVLLSGGLSSAIISTTNPIGSALVATALFREPLGRGLVLGTVLSVAGGLISVMGGPAAGEARFGGGEILIVIANVLWTWMSIAAQRWLRGFSQLQISALTVGGGALWLVALAPFVALSGMIQIRLDFGLESVALIAFAGAVPIALGNFFWHYGVNRIGIVIASMYNNLLPGIALGATVLMGGSFSWAQVGGSLIIVVGVAAAQVLALRRPR